jgi:hypothetical protein
MKVTGFWDIEPCSLVEFGSCFRGAYCRHYQGGWMDEDKGRTHLWNIGQRLRGYTAQYSRNMSSLTGCLKYCYVT